MNDESKYLKKLEKMEPLLGGQVNSLMAAFHQGSSLKDRLQAGGIIDLLYQQYCRPDLAEPSIVMRPPSQDPEGEILLGTIKYRNQTYGSVKISTKKLTRHMGIWGTTGSGKTNLVHILVDQLLDKTIPFTIFDWKQNFRSVLGSHPERQILYYTVGSQTSPFYWNPLIPPPNTDWEDWLKLLIEAMKHAMFLGHGVERILQQVFFGLADGIEDDTIKYPTFQQALSHLEGIKAFGREAMWIDSAKRALGALSFGGISKVFNTPFSVGPRLDLPVIYGLETLTDSEKTFFTEALCLWTYFARLNQDERKTLEHVFIIEEAHNILTRQKQSIDDRESLMDGILRQVRELGEGFVIIDQQPSTLTNSALANLNTHFVFNMHNEADIRAICDSIGLHGEDREYLKLLRPGESIVKLTGVPHPFHTTVEESPRNGIKVKDDQLGKLMWRYSIELAFKSANKHLKHIILALRGSQIGVNQNYPNNKDTKVGIPLNNKQMDFIRHVHDHPDMMVVERYRDLGLTAYMGDKIKEQLISAGLITQEYLSTKSGRISLLKITPNGLTAIGEKTKTISCLTGGVEHEYWKRKISDAYKEGGWSVESEVRLGGKQYDIIIRKNGIARAVEIETGKGNIPQTIRKLQEAPFSTSIVVAVNSSAEASVSKSLSELSSKDRSKIIVTTADRLILIQNSRVL